MEIADLIIKEINENKETPLTRLRTKLKNDKKLGKQEYSLLIRLIEEDPQKILGIADLSNIEVNIIGKALVKSKIKEVDRLVAFLLNQDDKKTPVFLQNLLSKRCKISGEGLEKYLERACSGNPLLCHLRLLLITARNYPQLLTPALVEFARGSPHPVCKAVIQSISS